MKKIEQKKTIVLTAGGTGGHVYPADALAEELEVRGYNVVLFTDARGLNNYKGKLGQIENKAIYSGSVVGKSIATKICSLFKVGAGVMQAAYYLIQKKPCCVVGFGGYASFPTAVAAVVLGIPLVIHEQNSVMSRTNRILARFASLVAQSFRDVKNTPKTAKTFLSGMPIRQAIAKLHDEKNNKLSNEFNLLVVGGSQGAKIFAEVVPEAVKLLMTKQPQKLKICQQCRQGEENNIKQKYDDLNIEAVVNHFFENMPELYKNADVIISRAGASSVYEIAAAGIPAILVPLPTAADNHQYYNAKEFATEGAGVVLPQSELTPIKLAEILNELMQNQNKRLEMSEKAKKIAIVDAAKRLADGIENLIQREKK